jgi:bifunctional DNA-binding transcriptional regulator/antitoxin component of YhaV-PrlF toxin-antitoxin module
MWRSSENRLMKTILTSEGQITIPKSILEATGLEPGAEFTVLVSEAGDLVLRQEGKREELRPDRFERALGSAEIKFGCTTDEYMEFLRDYESDPPPPPLSHDPH